MEELYRQRPPTYIFDKSNSGEQSGL